MARKMTMTEMLARIKELEREIEQRKGRIRDLQAKSKDLKRRSETRTKIIYGHAYLKSVDELSPEAQEKSLARVEKRITRKTDREFVGVNPMTDPAKILATAELPSTRPIKDDDLPFPV